MDRTQTAWPASDLHRRAPRQGGTQDANQQERPQRCGRHSPHHAEEVRVKDLGSHAVKALLASRALLVKIKRDLENQVRGLLKNLGLVIGRAKFDVFAVRAEGLIENRPELAAVIRPLLRRARPSSTRSTIWIARSSNWRVMTCRSAGS
jgi:transposase